MLQWWLHYTSLQAALVVEAAKEAEQMTIRETGQEEALLPAAGQLQDLELALTQATAANLDLVHFQR